MKPERRREIARRQSQRGGANVLADPFKSARLKLDRAKHHIDEMEARVMRFQAKHPYEVVVEADSEPEYKVHKLRLTESVPLSDFSLLIGDAIQNVRAALDHATYACAIASGNNSPSFRTCNFPFGNNLAAFENAVEGCSSVPEEVRSCLRTFQAHKDGNADLWGLNKMANWDKHALVTPVLTGYENIHVRVEEGSIVLPRNPHWDSAKNEVELFRTKDGDLKYEFAISFDIAIDSPDHPVRMRAVLALDTILKLAEGIVCDLERASSWVAHKQANAISSE